MMVLIVAVVLQCGTLSTTYEYGVFSFSKYQNVSTTTSTTTDL